jgi:hypothetical protein
VNIIARIMPGSASLTFFYASFVLSTILAKL